MENIAKVAGPSLQTEGVISAPGPASLFSPADGRSRFRMNAVGCNMARRSGRPQLEIKVNPFPFRQPLRKTGEAQAGNG